jgi:hypothetical protein
MGVKARVSVLEGLIVDILASTAPVGHEQSLIFTDAVEEIRFLSRHDYGSSLKMFFNRCEIQGIIAEGRRWVWPHLNRRSFRLGPPQEFITRWSHLDVDFRLAHISSPQGLALMGFYVKKAPASKRPLICVNTAHHQVAMGLAFSHEMGHHLTAEMFDSYKEPGRFLLYTGYAKHLADPVELAADILVSLGTFPSEIAQALFDTSEKNRWKGAYPRSRGAPSSKIIDYFRRQYGLAFESGLSAEKRLQYLAAVVHYTQLRRALLTEYNL